jgi:hypothetical protein
VTLDEVYRLVWLGVDRLLAGRRGRAAAERQSQ